MGVELPNGQAAFREIDDVNYTDMQLVYHVKHALASVQNGDRDSYNRLVGVMHYTGRLAPNDVALLETSLKALSGAVTCIDVAHHSNLLSSIFRMSMWNSSPHVMDALVDLIVSLAISSEKYRDQCLTMLVDNFMPPHYFLDKLTKPRVIAQKHDVLSRVHTALQRISDLMPLTPEWLYTVVRRRMPTIHKKDHLVVLFVENILKLESSSIGKFVGSKILMLVMERLRDLDVEIGWDETVRDESSKGIFEMELEDVDDVADAAHDVDSFSRGFISQKSLGRNIIADLLDTLMVLTFEHLRPYKGAKDAKRLDDICEILFKSFEELVLNTYKSKFAQFVMFYACAQNPQRFGLIFPTKLADIFVSNDKPPLTRMSAVAYLASYLSRAKFLEPETITTMLNRLVDWCAEYCQIHDGDYINPELHQVFYSGCQAIMYTLCFRMKSIIDIPRLEWQLRLKPLEAILKHKLNPLMVCLPSVAAEFLHQAKAARLYTVSESFIFEDLLESDLSRAFGGRERLDMFFPFDPCLLKKCDSYIRPDFLYWSMVRKPYDDEDDAGNGSDDEDAPEVFVNANDDFSMDEEMATSFCEQDLDIDNAMNKMSITPKSSFKNTFGDRLGKPMRMPSRIRPSTSPESL